MHPQTSNETTVSIVTQIKKKKPKSGVNFSSQFIIQSYTVHTYRPSIHETTLFTQSYVEL
jgi:hypothetical protein